MESSKRIFVVLSAILFLEASAFDSYPTYQTYGSTNYPSNLQNSRNFPTSASQSTGGNIATNTYGIGSGMNLNTGLNSGSTLFEGLNGGHGSKSGSTLFSGSNSHASAFSTGLNSGSTLYGRQSNNGYGSTLNTDSKIGSNLYSSSNIGHESTFNTGLRIGSVLYGGSNGGYKSTVNAESGYGSAQVGAFKSKLNDGSSFSNIHSLPLSTTTHAQPLLTTNSQSLQSYNSLSTNPSTNLHLSQNYLGGSANSDNDKFKIVHIPITTGSQISQSIKLPLTGNANYKVLHMNPTITNIPDNVLTDIKRAEFGVHKTLDVNTLSRDKVSLGYHNYNSGKNIPSNVFDTIKQAESELSEMVGEKNQKESSYNNHYYPGTNNFNNHNQTYGTTQSQKSSSNSLSQDARNVYDINFGENITPNKLNDSLTQADEELKEVLNDYEKVKGNQPDVYQSIASSNSAASSIGAGSQNGYDFSGSNTLYNHNRRYDNSHVTPFSYSNAQSGSSSGTVEQHNRNPNEYDSNTRNNLLSNNVLGALKLADVKLEKILDSAEGEKTTTYTSTNSSSFTGDQYNHLPLYNNGHHYTSSTLKTPNQSYGYDHIASSPSFGNVQASASAAASSTSQNGYKPNGYYNYPNLSFPKYVTTVAAHSNTAANSENESKSQSSLVNAQTSASAAASSTSQNEYNPNSYYNYPNLSFPKHVTTIAAHSNTAANSENESKSQSSLVNAQASASAAASSTSQNGYNPNGYYNYPNLSFPKHVTTVAAHSNTAANSENESKSQSSLVNAQASASAAASSTSQNGYNGYNPNGYYNYPNLFFPEHVTTVAAHSNTATNSENKSQSTLNNVPNKYNNYHLLKNYNYTSHNWQKHPSQPASVPSQTADLSETQYMFSNNPTNLGNMQYNTNSQQNINRENYHKYSSVYGQTNDYRFNIPQSSTTLSPIDEYTVSTNNPYIYENVQASSVDSFQNDKWAISVNSETTASAEVAAAQDITNIPHQTADSDRQYLFNEPTYDHQPHIIQSTDLPEKIVTDNPISTGNEQDSALLYSQNSFESNDPTDNIPYSLYNNLGMTSTQSPYFLAHEQYYGDQSNVQAQTTDFPVDEYAIPNDFDNYNSNLPMSPVDNSLPPQYYYDGANIENQDSTVDTAKSTVDSSTANSHAQNMNYRYHPRYHRLNWRKHELPPYAIKPQLTRYNNAHSDNLSLGDTQESTVAHSETSYKSDDASNVYLANGHDITQTSSAENSNDGIHSAIDYGNNKHYIALPDNSQQSVAVANSQSTSSVEVVNSDNVSHNNNPQLYNQPTLNQYTNNYNNQQLLINNQNSNMDGYPSNNQANGDMSTTPTPTIVTTTDSVYYEDSYDENYNDSELDQLVQTDKIVQIDSNGLQYVEGDKDQITNSDSSSSSTVIQEQDNLVDDQDKSLTSYNTKTSGFSKLSTSLNKNLPDTPYSRAFDALIKILDSLEKLFGIKNKP